MSDPRPTLLFVDDEQDVLDILVRMFERRFHVLTAGSGAEALALLRQHPVDVLVTDQKMPEMTGIELVAAARAEGLDVTTLLLTGYTDPEDIIAAINRGQVHRYITKPWDVNDLLITVNNAVEVSQLRREKDRLVGKLNQRIEALSVLYEVSHESAGDPPSYDAIIDRVLVAVSRILPYDCGAALVALEGDRSATLRLRCQGTVGERALLFAKDAVLGSHRKRTGLLLSEDRVITRVIGAPSQDLGLPPGFASQLTVSLVVEGRPVGTLCLFSQAHEAYSSEDAALLDVLANQTASAIRALRASEEQARRRIERMVESMSDGVLLTDERHELVVLNPAARRLLGLEAQAPSVREIEERLGFSPFELVRGWEYGGAQARHEELSLEGRTLLSTVVPVSDARGELRGICVVLRDVTEQKELEARKDEFVSMVSHELRTPLTSISGALDLVLNFLSGDVNEKQRRYLSMAKDATDKLNAVVDDLLDLSKFDKGRLRMDFEVTCLDELVHAALEGYGAAFLERRIRVQAARSPQPLRMVADPKRLHQVLANLLTNAAKFTPLDGELRVDVGRTPALPGFSVLTLWNSGPAVPAADLERIFDRFEQARSEATRTVRGTGLGLSIVRHIVEAHGGRVWAEPCEEGARFVLVLPDEPPTAPRAQDPAKPARSPSPEGHVLIVQEDLRLAYALKAQMLLRGHGATVSTRAEEGLALARRLHPSAAIVDVHLPDLDGLRLAEILRHDPETSAMPLLLTSMHDERQEAFRAGAQAFLTKPYPLDKLHASMDSLLRGQGGRHVARILVVDDDPQIGAICGEVLENLGYEIAIAGSLADARRALRERRPDLLLLDIGLPDGEGFVLLEELKAERAGSPISVVFLSARTETASKVRALKLGGDDYLTKPFDALELAARVERVLRRKEQELGSSPTTQLPGSTAIEREVQRRLAARLPFAFCYLDLDNLKAYNDYYGFAKADGVVRQTGDLLRDVLAKEGVTGDFLGHVAGDDFVFVTSMESVDRVCQRAIESFDRLIPLYYDRQDRERGHIETEDRFGQRRRFPIMSVSIVAVMSDGVSADHAELARLAADLKKQAKAIEGSIYLRSDRGQGARNAAG